MLPEFSMKATLMAVLSVIVIFGGGFVLNFQYQAAMLDGPTNHGAWALGMFITFVLGGLGWVLGILFLNGFISD